MTYTEVYKMIKQGGMIKRAWPWTKDEGQEAEQRASISGNRDYTGYEDESKSKSRTAAEKAQKKQTLGDRSAGVGTFASQYQPGGYIKSLKDYQNAVTKNTFDAIDKATSDAINANPNMTTEEKERIYEKNKRAKEAYNAKLRGVVLPVIQDDRHLAEWRDQDVDVPQRVVYNSRRRQATKGAQRLATRGTNAQTGWYNYNMERGRINQEFFDQYGRPATDKQAMQRLSPATKQFIKHVDPETLQRANIQGRVMVRNNRPRIPAMPSVANTSYSAIG